MAALGNIITSSLQSAKQMLIISESVSWTTVRNASKKTGGSTRNKGGHARPKHRGWRVQDGHFVQAGTILATQLTTRFHPGLNVGWGRNGTLFALEAGKVMVTCEQIDPKWENSWVQRNYNDRMGQKIYKKHFNVIPAPQHHVFKLIEKV
ncbi:39S ribosomal protein L27, mitochondrial [Cephus cinctus]|uniref:Large ribosomal subunit protein bL27m n=1 Tax=Cephus cinctus TaxID=211228 RepID=A0AAJ7FG61_CEPCN|nr:39S ribosomal protein L27, mitochondrial [Cephus cinctus]